MQNTINSCIEIIYINNAKELYGENNGLSYATSGSAGADLRANITAPKSIEVGERAYIPTGISIAMPEDIMGGIYSRSGLGSKHGIVVTQGVGVIDSDYRGEIFVALCNRGDITYTIERGERIAQIVFHYIMHPILKEVKHLSDTERGTGAFGHSGRE